MKYLQVVADKIFEEHFKALKQVFLCITNSCNLRCIHCLYKPWLKNGEDIEIETAVSLLVKFRKMGAIKLSLLGGEPTLYDLKRKGNNLFELIEKAHEIGYKYIRLVTNGIFEKDILYEDRFRLLNEISFSIDGPSANIHDALRSEGIFEKAVINIKEAIKLYYNVNITTCVHRGNIIRDERGNSLVEQQIIWASDLGVSRINFHPIFKMGVFRDKWTGETDINPAEWIKLYSEIQNNIKYGKYRIPVRIPQRFTTHNDFESNPKYYGYCPVKIGERIEVHPNRLIQICALLKGASICIARFERRNNHINISWEKQNNELAMFGFDVEKEHPCAIMRKNFKNWVPLCISFKPRQDEIIWNKLGMD